MTRGIARPVPIEIYVDGKAVSTYEGESLATALMASGVSAFSTDRSGRKRGPFCNMGICYDCVVLLANASDSAAAGVRVRSCLAKVRAGMRVRLPE